MLCSLFNIYLRALKRNFKTGGIVKLENKFYIFTDVLQWVFTYL